MTPLPPDPRRSAAPRRVASRAVFAVACLAAIATAALLAACGPGVGGTGTGEEPVGAQGARPANVCDSELGPLLGCQPSAPTGVLAPGGQDAQPLWFADVVTGRAAVARFAGQAVQLELRCPTLRFEGLWGQSDALGGRYFGALTSESSVPLASLRLQRDGQTLVAQLFDFAGQPVGPALHLVAVPVPPPAPGC